MSSAEFGCPNRTGIRARYEAGSEVGSGTGSEVEETSVSFGRHIVLISGSDSGRVREGN